LNNDSTAKELRDASGNLPAQRHHPSVVQCEVAYDMFRVFGSASASKKQLFNVSNCVAIRERVVLRTGCWCSADRCGRSCCWILFHQTVLLLPSFSNFHSPFCRWLGSSIALLSWLS